MLNNKHFKIFALKKTVNLPTQQINQPTNLSATNQPTNQPTYKLTILPINQPTDQQINSPANLHPTNKHTN